MKPILPYQQTNDYNTSFAINRHNVIEGACSFWDTVYSVIFALCNSPFYTSKQFCSILIWPWQSCV